MQSFKILTITDAQLNQKDVNLLFIQEFRDRLVTWWKFFDAGAKRLDEYEPHYYELLVEANPPRNRELYNIIKSNKSRWTT